MPGTRRGSGRFSAISKRSAGRPAGAAVFPPAFVFVKQRHACAASNETLLWKILNIRRESDILIAYWAMLAARSSDRAVGDFFVSGLKYSSGSTHLPPAKRFRLKIPGESRRYSRFTACGLLGVAGNIERRSVFLSCSY
jgi:hypothetical protein